MISAIDLILVLILFGFIFYGFFFGFIRTIGSLIALALGVWVASHYYGEAYSLIQKFFLGYDTFGKVFAFLLLFTIVNRLIMLGFSLLEATFNLLTIIPFLKTFNRLGGALLGLLEGSIFVAVLLFFISNYSDLPIIGSAINNFLANSQLSPYFLKLAGLISPILPTIIDKAKGMV